MVKSPDNKGGGQIQGGSSTSLIEVDFFDLQDASYSMEFFAPL